MEKFKCMKTMVSAQHPFESQRHKWRTPLSWLFLGWCEWIFVVPRGIVSPCYTASGTREINGPSLSKASGLLLYSTITSNVFSSTACSAIDNGVFEEGGTLKQREGLWFMRWQWARMIRHVRESWKSRWGNCELWIYEPCDVKSPFGILKSTLTGCTGVRIWWTDWWISDQMTKRELMDGQMRGGCWGNDSRQAPWEIGLNSTATGSPQTPNV